jgi:carbamoyl-phosphate synthase small subunit
MAFTTTMSGYQEAVTDPSYRGQILTFAAPMVGNYGTGPGHAESDRVHTAGVIMVRAGDLPGVAGPVGWASWLRSQGVVAVDAVDTRRLVTHLRERGALRGGISTELDADTLGERVLAHPLLDGRDLVTDAAGPRRDLGESGPRIAAIDCGMKESIARRLVAAGCRLTVLPAGTSADEVLAVDPAGVFVSNGPGDPAAATTVIDTIRELVGRLPIAGICMGHQLLAHAAGLSTTKLPFGHRGANHPVRRMADDRVEITVQNHGYAVVVDEGPTAAPGARSHCEVTHRSLFDGSVEGIALPGERAWSVQFHPEGRPGPNDAGYLFDRIVAGMR